MRYTVILEREEDGRAIATVPGVPGCHAYGSTPSEAVRRVKSALSIYLKQVLQEGRPLPVQPKPIAVVINLPP